MAAVSVVFPVRYVSEGVAVQTTSRDLTALGIAVRSLAPPPVGARVSMALYLPNTALPEVAIARVSRAKSGSPGEAGFWADFVVVDAQARVRIARLLERDEEASKRTYQRKAVQLGVAFRTGGDFVREQASNLSRAGVFIRTDNAPPIDTAVEVELQLPDGGGLVLTAGVVVHSVKPGGKQEAGAGVQFVDASDAFRERIDRFMESLLKN